MDCFARAKRSYLLGKLKMYHDSEVKHITVGRLFLAIVSFSFALWMLPGMWGAPLKAISSFAPSMTTQSFDLSKQTLKPYLQIQVFMKLTMLKKVLMV